jgi:hypothetical protein
MAAMYSKIKEFGDLVTQANRLDIKEIKLDRNKAVELLSEINKLLLDRIEQLESVTVTDAGIGTVTGGGFTSR